MMQFEQSSTLPCRSLISTHLFLVLKQLPSFTCPRAHPRRDGCTSPSSIDAKGAHSFYIGTPSLHFATTTRLTANFFAHDSSLPWCHYSNTRSLFILEHAAESRLRFYRYMRMLRCRDRVLFTKHPPPPPPPPPTEPHRASPRAAVPNPALSTTSARRRRPRRSSPPWPRRP